MPTEKPLYAVVVERYTGRELSNRRPVFMTGGLNGFNRQLSERVELPIERHGSRPKIALFDAPVGGIEIPFSSAPLPPGNVEPGDIVIVTRPHARRSNAN